MQRCIKFDEGHTIFRDSFKRFLQNEIGGEYEKWEGEGVVPRELWKKCGENGYLLPWASEKYGGSGADFLYSVITTEELIKFGATGFFLPLHNDVAAPYIYTFGNEKQRERWIPGCVSGDTILAIAMTEPEAGSDLASLKTTAVKKENEWILNGQKTFISNGILSDVIVIAAKTGGPEVPAHKAISLFVVERDTPGFSRGEPIKKIGLKAQDTAELFFDDCRIPEENLLGEPGQGFVYLMQKLQQERLMAVIASQSAAEKCLELTVEYVKERQVFGKPLSSFQNTRFVLAEIASEIEAGRSFVDQLIKNHIAAKEIVRETSMAKYWVCEMHKRTVDRCLQLFGGYGYCTEYPISRYYLDARIQTIYGGTSEVMKLIVSKSIGL